MSVRLRIALAVVALALAAFAVLGDGFFQGVLGLPRHSGRIVVAGVLLFAGVVWFVASSKWAQRINRDAASRRRKD
jgi:small neutral amino acid transporter SnatA (MarC family)